MSYYGDGIPYYYGGPFATHSSLMTGTGRIHTPLRYAPHLSTISESPLSTYRRYAPSSTSILPPSSRAKRIIDTADIDVSTPRTYQSSNSSPHQRRLRRDRPTIKIRSQAIKDNPALRDHYERREKSIGEQLVEKFLIKEKKPDNQGVHQEELSSRMPLFGFGRDVDDQQQEAIQKRVTRRMTRRRSSADVQMDPEQLEREMVIAQVQAEVLDNLVAEEQAEIEVETRKGTLIHKNTLRAGPIPKKSDTEEDDLSESKKKLQKKIKKRKKTTDKPSPPDDDDEQSINDDDDDDDKIKLFKIEACNSVGDFSTILVNTGDKLNDKIEQFRESIHLPSPRAPGIIGKIEEEINQSDEEIVVLPVKKSYVLDKSRNSVYLTLKQQVGKLNEEEEEDDEKHRETADLNHLNELKTNNDVLLIDANIRSKDNTESDVEVVNRDFNNTLESKEELIDENKREKKSLLTGEIDHKNCSISREVCQVDDSDLLEAKKLSTDLEEPWNKNLVNNNNKSFDVIITENSKNFVKQEREKSQDNTKNFNNCLLDDFKKIKDKVVTGDIENTNLKKILNFDNKCKLIDDILEVVDDKIKSHVEIESLPNAKLININVTLDEKKNSFGPIEKEKSLKDCKKVFDDNFVDDKIEKTVNKVEKNIDKLNRSVSLNTDQVSVSKKEKELEPLKNKNLTKLKFSSTDSGIGSIDSDIVCKTPDQSLKKTLTSSKGFSFECDEEIRPKLKQDSSSRETTPEIKENNKIIPVKRVKKKLIATKKLASFEEEPQEKLDLSKKDIVLTRIEKSISLVADETKEKIKDSTDDVDFWSEIKSDKAIKKEKILLKKTASEPSSKISSNENCVKEDQLELNSSLKVSEIKKINKVDELFVNEDKKIDDKINKVVEEKNNEVKEEAKEEEEIKDEKIIKTILESCVKASTLDNKNSNKISPSSTELPEESANDKEKIIELNEQLILQDLEEEEEENKILGKSDMVVDPKVQEEKEEQEKKDQEIENNSLEFVDNSRATIVPSGLVLDKSLPGLKVDASKEEPSELNINEVIEAIEKKEDKEKVEEDEDESPKTPTNEEEPVLTTKISKWDKSLNLFELDNEELLSTTTSTTTETPEKEKEVNASPSVSPQTSPKKKLTKRKKSSQKSGEKSLIRKIRGGDKSSGNNSKNTTLKADKKKLSTATSSSSPRASKKVNQLTGARPQELIKMFYTTPALLLTATPRDLSKVKRVKIKKKKNSTRGPSGSSDSTGSSSSTTTTESSRSNSTEVEDDVEQKRISSTRSNDSGFDGSPRLSTPSQSSDNQRNSDSSDHVHGSGRITPPATNLPRFKKYTVEDFNFLKVLGKGSFGKVLLAELRGTDCVYAVKCLKKDVVLEDDDVECTLIERKVLTLATRHPYLCHLFCTFQTESHLFFVMEYLNGGDLMFHIQKSGRFAEFRARFYAAEIWSGLNFLHKKGIVYRDLKLDNVLLDFEGHIRIADFGMCKLQIFLDRTADTFCGTPDYMAPEIIKGLKYNQAVDWWSFGVLLYEMLTGQSPFSGCDEDELFWSICNERPFIPRYLSQEAMNILVTLLEKDSAKRPLAHEIQGHPFFHAMQWERLERRMLEPPFKPALEHTLDTRYFDTAFTAEKPRLTPVPEQILTSMDQGVFRGFSYTNPNATD